MSQNTTAERRDDRAAVDKAISLLMSFGDRAHTGVGVSELARRADLSKSTAFRVLALLERNEVVERVGSNYRLGHRLQELGAQGYSPAHERLRDALAPYLIDLYELTHETIYLGVLVGADVVYLNKLFGHRHVNLPSGVGGRAPAYCTSIGKALLAYDADAAELVLQDELTAWTPRTLISKEAVRAALVKIRLDGVAFDDEESRSGISCVAVPVMGAHGRPVAALSIAGATGRFDPRRHVPALRRVSHEAGLAVALAGRVLRVISEASSAHPRAGR